MNDSLFTFSSKDWVFLFNEQLQQIPFLPFVWDPMRGNGFGGNVSSLLWARTYFDTTVWTLFNIFKLNWLGIELVIFWLTFLILSFYSVYSLTRTVFGKSKLIFFILAALIYIFNTYILMVLNGGQLGISLAYAIAPFVLAKFIELVKENENINLFKKISVFSLAASLQILFDPRIFVVTMSGIIVYFFYSFAISSKPASTKNLVKNVFRKLFISFVIPGALTFLLHLYWILPFLIYFKSAFSEAMGVLPTANTVKFFSFSDFSHSFSLLHPNWPENIFGKTYFLQPEFLLLPILAYSSLFFLKLKVKNQKPCLPAGRSKSPIKSQNLDNNETVKHWNNDKLILFFALLGLIGVFLAKGAKEPFGEIYLWLFEHIPGFILFRDSTKFYLLITLSYSVLIPFSIWNIYNSINPKFKIQNSKLQFKVQNYLPRLFLLFTILYLLFLIRPVFLGQIGGAFNLQSVPQEYVQLKDYIYDQKEFFRTLWIPQKQRFGFQDNMHPSVSSLELFNVASNSSVLQILTNKNNYSKLEKSMLDLNIKYLIVPYDNQEEFFIDDRKYNENIRQNIDKELKEIPYLRKNDMFKYISVYELKTEKTNNLFRLESKNKIVFPEWETINPTKYKIYPKKMNKNYDIIFSQTYDPNWVAITKGEIINSRYKNKFQNVFQISDTSDTIYIEYKLQKYMQVGLVISIFTFLSISFILLKSVKTKT